MYVSPEWRGLIWRQRFDMTHEAQPRVIEQGLVNVRFTPNSGH